MGSFHSDTNGFAVREKGGDTRDFFLNTSCDQLPNPRAFFPWFRRLENCTRASQGTAQGTGERTGKHAHMLMTSHVQWKDSKKPDEKD